MTWRGSISPLDRLFACLPYLLPLLVSFQFGIPLFTQFPVLQPLLIPFLPLLPLTGGLFGLVIFFALFMLVVRNDNINRFIRFNTMQAILLDILLVLCGIIVNLVLRPVLGGGLFLETIYNVIFLGTLIAVIYSVIQSALGRYAEIPTLSDAVHMQVR